MPFGNSKDTRPSRVYAYGARIAKGDIKQAVDILWKSNKYRNALIAIERERREKRDVLQKFFAPDLTTKEADVQTLCADIKALEAAALQLNVQAMKKQDHKAVRATIKVKKAALKALEADIKAIRTTLYATPAYQVEQEKIEEERNQAVRDARANCDIPWGTYLQIDKSRSGDWSAKTAPRFCRFNHDGLIAVQIQGGMPTADLFGGDTRIQIDQPTTPGKTPWRKGRIRIGSQGRDPIWLPFEVKIHRDLPTDADVKWVWLSATKVGTHIKWSLQVTLRRQGWDDPKRQLESGVVAVDVGWRKFKDRLRIGVWRDTNGKEGEISIPQDQIDRMKKVQDLQSIRDKEMDTIRETLVDFSKNHGSLPDWYQERFQAIHMWKSTPRLAGAVIAWRSNRFAGDQAAFDAAEKWRQQDKHLYDWQMAQWRNFIMHRREVYRRFAADMSRRYRTVVIEDIDWRKFARNPDGLTDEQKNLSRWYNKLACVSSLNLSMKNKFTETAKVPPELTTQACEHCGTVDHFDAKKNLFHTCSHCGKHWDQDSNACGNIMALYTSGQVVRKTP